MRVPRQGDPSDSGRVNQKRRTRAAIVAAARELLAEGATPTVAEAAERGLVSRTTAYRYFPTQEALLLEVAVTADVAEIEALVGRPVEAADVPDRLREVIATLNRHVLAEEAQYRAVLRAYLDLWAAARARGEDEPVVREGRRTRWTDTVLDALDGTVPQGELDRLRAGLALVMGVEAMVALRDVARLDADEAVVVADWAAATLISAVLDRR